jgi:hypothetical protein
MALTGTITLSKSAAPAGQEITATVALTNSAATAVNILSIVPTKSSSVTTMNGQVPLALGLPGYLPGNTITVAPNSASTLSFSWGVTAFGAGKQQFEPSTTSMPKYFLGAVVRFTDGSSVSELICTPVQFEMTSNPGVGGAGLLDFSNDEQSYMLPVLLF